MDSLRDLLNNIQPAEAPIENPQNDDQPEEFEPEEWDQMWIDTNCTKYYA